MLLLKLTAPWLLKELAVLPVCGFQLFAHIWFLITLQKKLCKKGHI